MFNDPKVLALAFFGGILPSLLWLWFWVKEEAKKVEPKGLLMIVFIMGMLAVVCVLPIQKFIQTHIESDIWRLIGWASVEELMKYLAMLVILFRSNYIDEPIEWPIYLITAALGFAALENALFLIKPLSTGATTVGLLTGQLRFLGSTLLHTVSSGILGIALGVAFHFHGFKKYWHIFVGFIFAIALHSVFNFFIIRNSGSDFLKVFSFLWVVTIVVMLLFEKVRRMS
ncbi:MAG TPA: PrsW family glutamic-type intramembrane protease [Candidatus Paceibacterota bacterium]|jgi:RsiW-degrading membrane proteinase PrsW (M82 family)|nr:PrsW family glutamic-type intramembrane protease [Candidatus Paceibacterota bacterium]